MSKKPSRFSMQRPIKTDSQADWEWRYNQLVKDTTGQLATLKEQFATLRRQMTERGELADLELNFLRRVFPLMSITALASEQVTRQAAAIYGPEIDTAYHTLTERAKSFGMDYQSERPELVAVYGKIQAFYAAIESNDPEMLAAAKAAAIGLDRHLSGIAALMEGHTASGDKTDEH